MSAHKRIEYETLLEDLTFNSRPIIESLTVLAYESKAYAPFIVQTIEKRINKVPPEQKLPVLYLLDSIIKKNLQGEYLQLFSKNIVATFCHTFEKVTDPKKRRSLFKLRQTWKEIIPVQKLIAIDKHVHSIDSKWPVMPEPTSTPQSPTIFVNPKFIESNGASDTPLKSAIGGSKITQTRVRPKRVHFIDEEQTSPVVKKIKADKNVWSGSQQQYNSVQTTPQQVDEHLPPAIRMNPTLRIPDLRLKIPHLKQFYPSLVDLLYAGEQCAQCGLRFTEAAISEYRNHLNWHYQLNRKDKDGLRKTSRNWFLHPDDWYALKEGEQIEDRVFEQEQLGISCKVLPGEGIKACHLCGEKFQLFWEDDLEEWLFKDTFRTADGMLYHHDCYSEVQ